MEADSDIPAEELSTSPSQPAPILIIGNRLYATMTGGIGEAYSVRARIEGRNHD